MTLCMVQLISNLIQPQTGPESLALFLHINVTNNIIISGKLMACLLIIPYQGYFVVFY